MRDLEACLSAPCYRSDSSLQDKGGLRHAFFDRSAVTHDKKQLSLQQLSWQQLQETARETLGIARAVSVKQVHSARAVVVRQIGDLWDNEQSPPEADALVSCVPNLLLCVYTADCAPVLLFDPEARVCAALHAGWRGALGGIVQETVRSMRTLGARERRTFAIIGPTIGIASYPVGKEFRKFFLEQSEANGKFFVWQGEQEGEQEEQWHFDLPSYVRDCLWGCGVGRVRSLGIDTFSDRAFFSHRRSLREGEGERGRNLAAIAMCE